MDAQGKELADPVHQQRPAAGVAERERVRTEEEHRPHHLARERAPDSRRVGGEEVLLEADRVIRGDGGRGQVTEAGRDPVDDLAAGDEALDDVASLLHPLAGMDIQRRTGAVTGDRLDVVDGQVGAGQDDEPTLARDG